MTHRRKQTPFRAQAATFAERAERQSRLLDQALLETFPASDPVSVVLVG